MFAVILLFLQSKQEKEADNRLQVTQPHLIIIIKVARFIMFSYLFPNSFSFCHLLSTSGKEANSEERRERERENVWLGYVCSAPAFTHLEFPRLAYMT